MGPVIGMWRSMYCKGSEAEPRDSPGREEMWWVEGSEVAGCEYNNLRLRFLGERKRVVEFVQVVLFVGGLIVDTIPPQTNALSRG